MALTIVPVPGTTKLGMGKRSSVLVARKIVDLSSRYDAAFMSLGKLIFSVRK